MLNRGQLWGVVSQKKFICALEGAESTLVWTVVRIRRCCSREEANACLMLLKGVLRTTAVHVAGAKGTSASRRITSLWAIAIPAQKSPDAAALQPAVHDYA